MSEKEKGKQEDAGSREVVEPVVVGHTDEPFTAETRREIYNELDDSGEKEELDDGKEVIRTLEVMDRPQVAWGIPFDEVAYASWMIHMLAERFVRSSDSLITTESTYVVSARNYIHDRFLNDNENEYLIMVDSDVLLPRGSVHTLIALSQEQDDKAVISGWYHKKKMGDPQPAVYKAYQKESERFLPYLHGEIKENFLKGKTTRVAAVGFGCMLMPRGVAEQLGDNPYQYVTGDQPLGEDMAMARTLAGLRIDIRVCWPMLCQHLGVGYI